MQQKERKCKKERTNYRAVMSTAPEALSFRVVVQEACLRVDSKKSTGREEREGNENRGKRGKGEGREKREGKGQGGK